MGSSASKPAVLLETYTDEIEISTPGQLQYIFFNTQPEGCYLFGIKAAQNAYIALSSNIINPEYEILIGTSGNRESVITKSKNEVTKTLGQNILDKDEIRYFWLQWKVNKLLLGCKDEEQAFLYFNDKEQIPIKYCGICTYESTGTWIIKKKYEIVPINARNESTTTTAYSSNIPSSAASSSLSNSTNSSVPPHNDTETQEDYILSDLIKKKSNMDVENFAKINNNIANMEKTNKSNSIDYLDNFKNLNLKNDCDENYGSTCKDNLENLERKKLGTKTNQTSTDKSREHHRHSKKSETCMNQNPNNSSNKNNFKKQKECDNIISFHKLLEISRKSPQLIRIELLSYKFERLFEIKLKKSYINVLLDILSKLCKADCERSAISFFSKEVFRKQLLNYMHHMRLQSGEDYNKHLQHNNQMWKSLYIVCETATNFPAELQSGYLENLIYECQNTLETLKCRDESRKNVLQKFIKLKEYIYIETRCPPI